jgi:hypothetical protein
MGPPPDSGPVEDPPFFLTVGRTLPRSCLRVAACADRPRLCFWHRRPGAGALPGLAGLSVQTYASRAV